MPMVNAKNNRIKPKKASITSKQVRDYNAIATSYHEASHTIIALLNYFYVYNVNIVPKPDSYGEMNWWSWLDHMSDITTSNIDDQDLCYSIHYSHIGTLYAGLIGERLYYYNACGSDKFPMHLKQGSIYDYQDASFVIRKNKIAKPGRETLLLKKQIQKDIREILENNWEAVKVVAHQLYKKKRLGFDEIKHILTRKTENKMFWKEQFRKIKMIYSEKSNLTVSEFKKLIK
jgi:hypothetical protein